jgi:hypothetical protein
MPQFIELSPVSPSAFEVAEQPMGIDVDPNVVAAEGAIKAFRMGNCVHKDHRTEVCVDAVVCAADGCQRA